HQDVEGLLRAEDADSANHQVVVTDSKLRTDGLSITRRQGVNTVGKLDQALGRNALDLDHPAASLLGHHDHRAGAARNELAIDHRAQSAAREGAVVLVGDHDRHAGESPDHRAPGILAEAVGVKDVDSLAPQRPKQRPPGERVVLEAALEEADGYSL